MVRLFVLDYVSLARFELVWAWISPFVFCYAEFDIVAQILASLRPFVLGHFWEGLGMVRLFVLH